LELSGLVLRNGLDILVEVEDILGVILIFQSCQARELLPVVCPLLSDDYYCHLMRIINQLAMKANSRQCNQTVYQGRSAASVIKSTYGQADLNYRWVNSIMVAAVFRCIK